MSLITRRFTNFFPRKYKLREDRSSVGSRYISAYADLLEAVELDNKLLTNNLFLSSYNFPEDNYYIYNTTPLVKEDGVYIYPTVSGDGVSLVRKENINQFLYDISETIDLSIPTEHTNSLLFWDSTNDTYKKVGYAFRLHITVQNSTDYAQYNSRADVSEAKPHLVYIKGFDQNYCLTEEVIHILDDMNYLSKNLFIEVVDVQYQGFDGEVIVSPALTYTDNKLSYLRNIAFDGFISPLFYRLDNDQIILSGRELLNGESYRSAAISSEDYIDYASISLSYNDTVISNILDVYESMVDGLFYFLTEDYLYVANLPSLEFSQPALSISFENYVDVKNDSEYVAYNGTGSWWTKLNISPSKVDKIIIYYIDPDGDKYYLQADRTWALSVGGFIPPTKQNEKIWKDFKFSKTLDKYGQWDIYVEAYVGTTIYRAVTSTLVPVIEASTRISHSVDSPLGIFENNSLRYIFTSSKLYKYTFDKDFYYVDEPSGTIYLSKDYDNIELTYE